MNTISAIQSALDEVGKSENIISRAEDDLTRQIFERLLASAEQHDVVTETAKQGLLAMSVDIARASIDWISKSGGAFTAGAEMPRHVLADFLAVPANVAFLAEKASARTAQTVETAVLKRLRQQRERGGFEYERANTAPRNAEAMPVMTKTVWTGDTDNGGKYPAKRGRK